MKQSLHQTPVQRVHSKGMYYVNYVFLLTRTLILPQDNTAEIQFTTNLFRVMFMCGFKPKSTTPLLEESYTSSFTH